MQIIDRSHGEQHPSRRSRAASAVIVALLAGAACGGSDNGSAGSTTTAAPASTTTAVSDPTTVAATAPVASAAAPTTAPTTPPAPAPAAATGTVTVSIVDFAFREPMLEVPVGTTVEWVNEDSFAHSVVAGDQSFVSAELAAGDRFSFTFETAGSFSYACGIHPSMLGTIVVTG
jgi:plastocyanin